MSKVRFKGGSRKHTKGAPTAYRQRPSLIIDRLTNDEIRQMQIEWQSGKVTQTQLASKYNISQASVSNYVRHYNTGAVIMTHSLITAADKARNGITIALKADDKARRIQALCAARRASQELIDHIDDELARLMNK